jgi:two-component system, OmpR family, sensor kinase
VSARGLLSRQTLRTRLTVLLVALLLAACAAVGIASTVALRSFLIERLDQQLDQAGSRYAAALEHSDNDADNPETSTIGQPVGTLGARSLNGNVTAIGVVAASSTPLPISAADRAKVAALTPAGHNRTIELPHLGEYRVKVSSGQDGDVLVTGLPQQPVDETLRHVILAETLTFLIVVATVGLIGAIAVRRSLRPLARVASTALRVSELPLAKGTVDLPERVPTTDERTEVGQVSAAVNHMLERIEAALTERQRSEDRLRQFVADASHELRTPLAVVRSHAELITQEATELSEGMRSSLRRIGSETGRMSRLVDDLLLLARLDSGRPLQRQQVDLTRLAIDSVTDARVSGPDHRWSLDLPEDPVTVVGDEHRLHQVLVNLLANAATHTPAGTTVTLTVRTTASDEVQVIVHDDGPGISPELLPRVTERFVRGDGARSPATSSTGLGLPIVAGVVAAHGGTVLIASSPGDTHVTVTLPTLPELA